MFYLSHTVYCIFLRQLTKAVSVVVFLIFSTCFITFSTSLSNIFLLIFSILFLFLTFLLLFHFNCHLIFHHFHFSSFINSPFILSDFSLFPFNHFHFLFPFSHIYFHHFHLSFFSLFTVLFPVIYVLTHIFLSSSLFHVLFVFHFLFLFFRLSLSIFPFTVFSLIFLQFILLLPTCSLIPYPICPVPCVILYLFPAKTHLRADVLSVGFNGAGSQMVSSQLWGRALVITRPHPHTFPVFLLFFFLRKVPALEILLLSFEGMLLTSLTGYFPAWH